VSAGSGEHQQTDSSQTATPQVQASPPFFSPATHVDPSTGIAVLVVLDDQGKIVQQLPSQQVVDEYKRHQGPDVPASSSKGQQASGAQAPAVHTADASGSGTPDTPGQDQGSSTSQH
jgi:hypothetical protein